MNRLLWCKSNISFVFNYAFLGFTFWARRKQFFSCLTTPKTTIHPIPVPHAPASAPPRLYNYGAWSRSSVTSRTSQASEDFLHWQQETRGWRSGLWRRGRVQRVRKREKTTKEERISLTKTHFTKWNWLWIGEFLSYYWLLIQPDQPYFSSRRWRP